MTEEKKDDNTINLVANLAVLTAQIAKDLNAMGTAINQNGAAINQIFQRLNGIEIYVKNQLEAKAKETKNGSCCITPPPEAPPVAPPEAPSV